MKISPHPFTQNFRTCARTKGLENIIIDCPHRRNNWIANWNKEEKLIINYSSLIFRAVQEILNHIFIEMYNQQDTDERCFSDSLAELPDHNVVDGKKIRALNLDLIKRRLDRGNFRSDFFLKTA